MARRRNKKYTDWEGRNKTVFTHDTIFSVENLKGPPPPTTKALGINRQF